MEKKEANYSYWNMIVGSAGMLFLPIGILWQVYGDESMLALSLIFLGFSFIIHYIYDLEKRAGMSNKLIWFRAIIMILLVLGITVVYQ